MSEAQIWQIVDRIEDLAEVIEDMKDYLDQVYEHHEAYNNWIQVATDSIMKIQKDVEFIKNKKTCV